MSRTEDHRLGEEPQGERGLHQQHRVHVGRSLRAGNEMEGKLCQCHEEDVKVAEVKDEDDLTSELSYKTVYHTPVAIAGLLEDVPNRLVPISDLEITPGSFKEEVRDGDEDSDQELESVALKVMERVLEEDKDDMQVGVCFS